MKFRIFRLLLPGLLIGMISCGSNNALLNTGAGLLYETAQSNTTISAFTVDLGTGGLSAISNSIGTGSVPSAIVIAPSANALFVANSGSNSISSYTINSDGSLTAATTSTHTGTTPVALAMDSGGKFLFVANQASNNISVFSISGTTLTPVSGSPFTTIPVVGSYPNGTLPSGVAVSASGKFLYVSNLLTDFVSAFSISSTGALAPLGVPTYSVGNGPAGIAISPNGGFLYVANSGTPSNNISAFAICDSVVTSCFNVNSPDGALTPVTGSPFPAGLGPVAITFDPNFDFAYVVDKGSNDIAQYAFGTGTGVLTPLSPSAVSTGVSPVAIAVRAGTSGANLGNTLTNPTDYVYVANSGGSTISIFTLATTTGVLNVLGTPLTIFGQPSAIAVR
jgi:6-phosphogluconolactonase